MDGYQKVDLSKDAKPQTFADVVQEVREEEQGQEQASSGPSWESFTDNLTHAGAKTFWRTADALVNKPEIGVTVGSAAALPAAIAGGTLLLTQPEALAPMGTALLSNPARAVELGLGVLETFTPGIPETDFGKIGSAGQWIGAKIQDFVRSKAKQYE